MLLFSPGCKQGPWQLWHSYSARYIDPETGRVLSGPVSDPSGDQHTTSEGQAYALFFALAANDRSTFDRVLSWTQTNLAAGDLSTHLPAWLWGQDKNGAWTVLDPNSASDADVWIAYSLVEAGRLWNSPADAALGRALMASIAKNEVVNLPGFGSMLLPGPTGFQHGDTWTLNPSYLPLFLFKRLAAVDPAGPWHAIALNIPRLLQQSSRHGYAMDWVEYVPGDGFYPAPPPETPVATFAPPSTTPTVAAGNLDAVGSYDAIRVYLWAGMISPADPMRASILNAIPAMSAWLASHDAPPEKVSQYGIPVQNEGPIGFSAAVLPYLHAFPDLSQASARQLVRLNAQKSASSGLYGKDKAYYDQCLALFSTGFLQARFRFGPGGELNVEWKRE
ncbi:MAG: cellulose synthase complex periplasmic endoglucanase BcsZ [Terracidiphilus sp.]|jgi:endoglucanase